MFFAVAVLYAIRFFPTVRSMEYYNITKRFCPHGIAKIVVFTFSKKEKCRGAAATGGFYAGAEDASGYSVARRRRRMFRGGGAFAYFAYIVYNINGRRKNVAAARFSPRPVSSS